MIPRRNFWLLLWFFPAVILVIVGLAVGFPSHQVDQRVLVSQPTSSGLYENSSNSVTYHIAMGTTTGNVYINADGSSEYFVALNRDFTPAITQSDIDNSASLGFVARTDMVSVSVNVNGTTISKAHKIERLVFYDNNGNVQKIFITSEYASYLVRRDQPGYTSTISFLNGWPLGSALIVVGFLWSGGVMLIVLFRQQRKMRDMITASTGASSHTPQQSYYVQSPYSYPNIVPPPPYVSQNPSPNQYGQQVGQIEPTQFVQPPSPLYASQNPPPNQYGQQVGQVKQTQFGPPPFAP